MRRGKVVLVPFPFDDVRSSKVRPAVCLTEATDEWDHIVVAFIGTKIPERLLPTDVPLRAGDEDFTATGLRFDSIIRVNRLLTTAIPYVKSEIGQLSRRHWQEVMKRIQLLFENSNYLENEVGKASTPDL